MSNMRASLRFSYFRRRQQATYYYIPVYVGKDVAVLRQALHNMRLSACRLSRCSRSLDAQTLRDVR